MAQVTRDDPWHWNPVEDSYSHITTGEKLSAAQWQARQSAGEKSEWTPPWTPPPPPLPPQTTTSVAMVRLPDVLGILEDVGATYYHADENVKRFAAHVADRVRGLVNVRDPKELLR
jgi:hypothetical protein